MYNDTYKRIRRNVMRRVYTAYAASIVSSQILLYSSMFLVALAVFAHVVHVHRVLVNLSALSFGQMPQFIFNAVMRGEVLTLTAIGVMVFTALSIQWRLRSLVVPKLKVAHI